MLRALTLAGVLTLGTMAASVAQTPQRGGTLNFTAPYGTSFATLDLQAANTIQDEIFGSSIHRSLYRWDSEKNEPVLELATEVTVSGEGTVFTYKLRPNATVYVDANNIFEEGPERYRYIASRTQIQTWGPMTINFGLSGQF